MSASLQLKSVALRVSDLSRSLDFYGRQLGFAVANQQGDHVDLAVVPAGAPILHLIEDKSAAPTPKDTAGLFHAALLFPSRPALGTWLRRALQQNVEFDGASDHAVSEALYFSDPDGNGLEFYVDRPRATWPFSGDQVAMVTRPLDVQSLLHTASAPTATPLAGCRWGHLHLRVTDLERSEKFYHETLSLEVTQRSYPGARFMAADGYHHHLGLNTWGNPRRQQPPNTLGLISATFQRATASITELRDPDGIALRIEPPADEIQ